MRRALLILPVALAGCSQSERCALLSELSLSALCPSSQIFPGPVVMGDFTYTARLESTDCPFSDPTNNLPDGGTFGFEGTLSLDPSTGQAWLTLGGKGTPCACAAPPASWSATFDGQFAQASGNAPRTFAECGQDSVSMQETVSVALFSASQATAVGGVCPANALDGGVPTPTDGGTRDGGPVITPPRLTPGGFDARLACGELVDVVVPASDSTCSSCSWRYALSGGPQ